MQPRGTKSTAFVILLRACACAPRHFPNRKTMRVVTGLSSPGLGLGLLALLTLPTLTLSKAILGVDLGSLYMKVALVQRNSPLEIVTNLHSKRKTEQMVLFDQGTRFYGADANSMAARKPQKIPAGMSVMLGREAEHPTVKVGSNR